MPVRCQFRGPACFESIEGIPLFKLIPDGAVTQENIDGQLVPFVLIRGRQPLELVPVSLNKNLKQGQAHPIGAEGVTVGDMNLESVAGLSRPFVKERFKAERAEAHPFQIGPAKPVLQPIEVEKRRSE